MDKSWLATLYYGQRQTYAQIALNWNLQWQICFVAFETVFGDIWSANEKWWDCFFLFRIMFRVLLTPTEWWWLVCVVYCSGTNGINDKCTWQNEQHGSKSRYSTICPYSVFCSSLSFSLSLFWWSNNQKKNKEQQTFVLFFLGKYPEANKHKTTKLFSMWLIRKWLSRNRPIHMNSHTLTTHTHELQFMIKNFCMDGLACPLSH